MAGVKGMHPQLVIKDEISTAEALAADALANLQRLVEKPKPPAFMPCPFCQGGISVSAYSQLWGHVCWICSGWAVVPVEKQYLRGPIAPHPRRQFR